MFSSWSSPPPRFDLGFVRYVVNQVEQVFPRLMDAARVSAILGVPNCPEGLSLDESREADYRVQRGAKFVDYYGQELGLGSVDDLGLFIGGVYSPFRPFALSNVGYDCANRHDLTIAIRDRKLNREIGVDTVVQFSLLLLLYRLPGFQNGLIVRPKILGLFVGEEFTGCLALPEAVVALPLQVSGAVWNGAASAAMTAVRVASRRVISGRSSIVGGAPCGAGPEAFAFRSTPN